MGYIKRNSKIDIEIDKIQIDFFGWTIIIFDLSLSGCLNALKDWEPEKRIFHKVMSKLGCVFLKVLSKIKLIEIEGKK